MKTPVEIKNYIISHITLSMNDPRPRMWFQNPLSMEEMYYTLDTLLSYINETKLSSYQDFLGDRGFQASLFTTWPENLERWDDREMFEEFSKFFKSYMETSENYNEGPPG